MVPAIVSRLPTAVTVARATIHLGELGAGGGLSLIPQPEVGDAQAHAQRQGPGPVCREAHDEHIVGIRHEILAAIRHAAGNVVHRGETGVEVQRPSVVAEFIMIKIEVELGETREAAVIPRTGVGQGFLRDLQAFRVGAAEGVDAQVTVAEQIGPLLLIIVEGPAMRHDPIPVMTAVRRGCGLLSVR